ncbi:ABC transporter ATP-binding protein [Thermomicrobiaceae bacterium CFH 74404]|uniref:ABC transporter ATP-binding protein n=1 Tax=Thermalbibacter longus TaxID=2951981 RepID=A0AA41WEK1_9BACT|nr:ABC transporter ATP-binding protein [Thermalbibacter longus]MCM8747996.1 ABC transporter ATP-binding protein [Thermalbibacter longus]
MREPVLAITELTVQYGGIRAVDGASFQVAEGELVAIIGANGAGKSSTLRAIAGLAPVAGGDILLDGVSIRGVPAHELPRRGLALIPEGRRVFADLSVLDNLYLGGYSRPREEIAGDLRQVYELFPILRERSHQAAGTLSGGEQQMLAIARALMSRPRILLLDEPSLGLAPVIVQQVFSLLRHLRERGVTILLVEQNARLALEAAERGYIMHTGRIVLSGPARELAKNPEVRERYFGTARGSKSNPERAPELTAGDSA